MVTPRWQGKSLRGANPPGCAQARRGSVRHHPGRLGPADGALGRVNPERASGGACLGSPAIAQPAARL